MTIKTPTKRKFLVWQPDGYLEFVKTEGENKAEIFTHKGEQPIASVVSDGNGYDFKMDGKTIRLSYDKADYLVSMLVALQKARRKARRSDCETEMYELEGEDK